MSCGGHVAEGRGADFPNLGRHGSGVLGPFCIRFAPGVVDRFPRPVGASIVRTGHTGQSSCPAYPDRAPVDERKPGAVTTWFNLDGVTSPAGATAYSSASPGESISCRSVRGAAHRRFRPGCRIYLARINADGLGELVHGRDHALPAAARIGSVCARDTPR